MQLCHERDSKNTDVVQGPVHDVDMSLSYNRDQISMMKRAMDNDDRDSDK